MAKALASKNGRGRNIGLRTEGDKCTKGIEESDTEVRDLHMKDTISRKEIKLRTR
jgi:hypothetical protein